MEAYVEVCYRFILGLLITLSGHASLSLPARHARRASWCGVALSFLRNFGIFSGASGVLGALSRGVASLGADQAVRGPARAGARPTLRSPHAPWLPSSQDFVPCHVFLLMP